MNLSYINLGLSVHFLAMAPLLLLVFLKLRQQGLFHWLSAGFWAWGSMALYFIITPLIQNFGDPIALESRLAVTEGLSRMLWVTFCVALGMTVFFLAYFKTRPGRPRFGLPQDSWPPGTWLVIILMLAGAAYSMITFTGSYGFQAEQVLIVDSKYVGGTTGYQTIMYMFAPFIIMLLILRPSMRMLGYGLLGLFLIGRLNDPYNRVTTVSLLLAVSMVATALRARTWPPLSWIAIVMVFTLLMWGRGHMSLTEFKKSGQSAKENLTGQIQRGDDTSMLAHLYLKTYLDEKSGYSYGTPLISGVLFGPLPRKYFPWKDWPANHFRVDFSKIASRKTVAMMYGSKSSIIGDLYGYGNILAILMGMPLLGFLTRKLDGWVAPEAPVAVRALGYVWLGYFFMMYASSLIWVLQAIYVTGIPFLVLLISARLATVGKNMAKGAPSHLRHRYPFSGGGKLRQVVSRWQEYDNEVKPLGLPPDKPSI